MGAKLLKFKYLIFALSFFGLSMYEAYGVILVELYGREVSARVLNVDEVTVMKCKRKRILCRLGLSDKTKEDKEYLHWFEVDGQAISINRSWPIEPGKLVNLIYVENDPEKSEVRGSLSPWVLTWVLLALSIVFGVLYQVKSSPKKISYE